jgi:hypothetical protein
LPRSCPRFFGETVKYVDVPPEALEESNLGAGAPAWAVDNLVKLEKIKALVCTSAITTEVEEVLGRKPETFDEYLSKESK